MVKEEVVIGDREVMVVGVDHCIIYYNAVG